MEGRMDGGGWESMDKGGWEGGWMEVGGREYG